VKGVVADRFREKNHLSSCLLFQNAIVLLRMKQ